MPFVMDKKPEMPAFDGVVFPAGQHEFSLGKIECGLYQQFKADGTRADPEPHFRFTYKDDEGDIYQTQPMKAPKGFAFNEKAGFWKHVGALFGRTLTEQDSGAVVIDLGEGFDTWEDLHNPKKMPNLFAKKDEVRPLIIKSIKVHGKEIVSPESKVWLVLTVETKTDKEGKPKKDDEGNEIQYNKLSAILPYSNEGGAKKKKLPV